MPRVTLLASLVLAAASLVACSSDSTPSTDGSAAAATSPTCVDFVVKDDETTCTIATDCAAIPATRVCSGDPSCGGQVPVNHAGAARYDRETSAIPRTAGSCGAAAPEACVAGRCKVCNRPSDCPDGG